MDAAPVAASMACDTCRGLPGRIYPATIGVLPAFLGRITAPRVKYDAQRTL
ncbi:MULTISPECIES: hypothetical protein [unclassified Ensifer]|uniref:hypothetical protein n=1 Tax=unclassified Ensifer TaxID=2633371 RepID=UPI00137479F4|nr:MULTISPECIES: hypothetical protein [unclassified Ensifer]